MLFLFFSVLIISILLLGNGKLFSSLIKLHSVHNPFLYFWLGIFSTSTLAMLTSFFVPINNFALTVFVFLGALGLPKFISELRQNFGSLQKNNQILFVLFSFLTTLTICRNCGFNPVGYPGYDTALYHANSVQWLNEYGAVLGLGNLHGRLGMNSLWLTFASILDNFIFDGRTAWILPALMLIGGFLFFGYEFFKTNSRRIAVFCSVFLLFLIMQIIRPTGGGRLGLYFDTVVFIVYAILIVEVFYLLQNKRRSIPGLSYILILATFGYMLKQIGAISCIFAFIFVIYILLQNKKSILKNMAIVCLPAGVAFTIMLVNNCILSGYLFFPLSFLSMPFDWTMPKELADNVYNDIICWARLPEELYMTVLENDFWYWFKPWLARHSTKINFIVYLVPLVLSIILWAKIMLKDKNKMAIFFFIWSFANIIFWFKSAPDLRFGSGFFFVNIALSLMFFVSETNSFNTGIFLENKIIKKVTYSLSVIIAIAILAVPSFIPASVKDYSIFAIQKMGTKGVHEYTVQNVKNSYKVWIPNEGDQVGNSPLPATPYTKPLEKYGIEMRDKESLGAGFRASNSSL